MSNDPQIEYFKCDVRRFDTLDLQIKELNKKMKPISDEIKELKLKKQDLQQNICSFMETNEIMECKLTDGALLFKETKSVVPMKKANIYDNILKFFKEESSKEEYKKSSSEKKADMLFQFVYENRDYNEKKTLKRV